MVTGGAGFIGSNLVRSLNQMGEEQIIVVDDMENGENFRNLVDCSIVDYIDKNKYLELINNGIGIDGTTHIFHQGACSDTTEQDGRYMMENNYSYSKSLFHHSLEKGIAFIYASSAAIYGGSNSFEEHKDSEKPMNVYAYSKFLFDNYVRQFLNSVESQVVGLRYFNVYGPRESHKGHMASVAYHIYQQFRQGKPARLFKGTGGYQDGEQLRDFVYVDDAAALNIWFMQNSQLSGIYNAGTGEARTFNDIANTMIGLLSSGSVEYIDFPKVLDGKYQSFTKADLTRLRATGCDFQFQSLESGLEKYLSWLQKEQPLH